jgi:hypothetical protein
MILIPMTNLLAFLHLLFSLFAIGAGGKVLFGLLTQRASYNWTTAFLRYALVASLTALLAPIHPFSAIPFSVTHGLGMFAVYASGAAFLAWCKFHLAGRWRSIYVLSIAAVLCCNILFVTMQAFPRIPVMASMQSAPMLLFSQLALTVPVILLGMAAIRRYHHPQSRSFSQP